MFSGAIKVSQDISDFIKPSQECIVTLEGNKVSTNEDGLVDLQPKASTFNQTQDVKVGKPVKITLNDCLACSGCITSAETILLQQQSVDEFLAQLSHGQKRVVISIAPQSRASLAEYYGVSPMEAIQRLTSFFKSLGVAAVYDTSSTRDVALMENAAEFASRYQRAREAAQAGPKAELIPMLASACPGWVCYAEKTHGTYVLPYIATTKSPMAVMGSLLKRHLAQKLGAKPRDFYHVSVAPCYDKKLEASRDDFKVADEGAHVSEVDCVLTSGEVLELMQRKGLELPAVPPAPLDTILTNVDESGQLYGVPGGSGGYADYIFVHAAKALFGVDVAQPLAWVMGRNSDFQEISLVVDGNEVLCFAKAYGFRNIQNLVRQIKLGKSKYHYVEIMACPSGCLNGGGQIKPKPGQSGRQLIDALEMKYVEQVADRPPEANPIAVQIYQEWLGGAPGSERAKELCHTQYHFREKTLAMQIASW
eukprot:jgi/Mesvir1/11917/Mv00255-RA.1